MARITRVAPGQPVRADHINAIIEAVEANTIGHVVGGGIEVRKSSGGVLVSADIPSQPTLVKVNGAIAPGSTSAPTKGTGTFKTFDGTNYGDTSNSVDVYNRWDKTVADAAQVVVEQMFGPYWFITDVRTCNDLT